ncbi:retrovirus-related pol polyprotein from transposon TNT 1-94 [Tanacetum coccineum]|uniref:Retrovirus-related pol polyprotein from transposon TNT 1-94 n=1 Tax=Tanacetum coccineum TaxID=301880 RepID=A0ABQ5AG93_9ASTR
MVVENQSQLGEGSTTQPQKIQKLRKPKRKDTQVPQPSDRIENVADEAVHKELGDSLVRAATTASSLETEQDISNINKTQSKATPNKSSYLGTTSGGGPRCQETIGDTIGQTRFESVSKHSNDSLLARGNTLRSDEDRLKLDELMALCTTLQNRVLDLKKTKTTQHNEIASLKRRVKKLKKKNRSRTHKLKRLYKVSLTARLESFDNEESLGEDASKQGRINDIDADDEITLVSVQNVDEEMFDVNVLDRDLHGAHFLPLEFISDHFIRLSMATTQVPIVLDDSTFNPSMNQDDLVIGDEDASSSEPKLAPTIVNRKYDHIRMRESIAHWILMHEHSFSIVKEAGFDFMMKEWDIENKIYSTSMDNTSANDKAIKNLRRIFEVDRKLLCDGRLFHVRCCAHILNLIAQDGLETIKSVIKKNCKTCWNSTYEMLVGASKFKEVFPKYEERDHDFDSCPLKDDWVRVEQICKILEVFNNVTHIISGSDYPTSNLFLCEVSKVKQVLDGKKDDESEFIRKMVEKMKEKFDKYWAEVHLLMAIAAVLDPRTLRSLHSEYVTIYNESTTESKQKVAAKEKDDEVNVVEEVVEVINTAKTVSAATTTTATITTVDDITLAQALMEIKSTKPKEKGVVIQELGESTTTISSQLSSQQSQDKGKGILIEPVKPMKKKDLIRLDEEGALKLQAEFDEEERLAREKAEKEKEANIALIETWDDIQAKIDDDHQLKK